MTPSEVATAPRISFSGGAPAGTLVAVTIVALVGLSLGIRYQFFLINGGAASDYIVWAQKNYFGGITPAYLAGAQTLLDLRHWDIPGYNVGYPAVLAVLRLLGADSPQDLRIYQAALDSLTLIPLFCIGWKLSGARVGGLVLAALYAITPLFAFNAVMLLADALSPMLVASMLALMLWGREGGAARWFALGLIAAFAALVRPDLLLFPGIVAIWWLSVSRRKETAIAFVLGLALILGAWSVYKGRSLGSYAVTPPAGAYALWSGLGQYPNNGRYYVSDERAILELQSKGIVYHTAEAEAYWLRKYLAAWKDDTLHVVKSILWRLKRMPFDQVEYTGEFKYNDRLQYYLNVYGFPILCISTAFLLYRRRFITAFIIVVPLIYALGSLGLIYYEARYVRYISLSYIMAPVALIGAIPWLRTLSLLIFVVALSYPSIRALPSLHQKAFHSMAAETVDDAIQAGHGHVIAQLNDLSWQPVDSNVIISRESDGIHLTTNNNAGSYQMIAVPAQPSGRIQVRFEVDLLEGGVSVGLLSQDKTRWVKQAGIYKQGEIAGSISVSTPDGFHILLSNARAENGVSRAVLRKLEIIQVP